MQWVKTEKFFRNISFSLFIVLAIDRFRDVKTNYTPLKIWRAVSKLPSQNACNTVWLTRQCHQHWQDALISRLTQHDTGPWYFLSIYHSVTVLSYPLCVKGPLMDQYSLCEVSYLIFTKSKQTVCMWENNLV